MTDPAPASAAGPPGVRGQLAWRVAAAVDATGGVRRSGGAGVEVATQYRGGRVQGVRIGDGEIIVHVTAEQLDVRRVGDDVRAAVGQVLTGADADRRIVVCVDDIDLDSGAGASGRTADEARSG